MAETRYHPVAKLLHWATAVAVLGLIGLGLWMTGLPFGLPKLQAYAWHKWIGLTVLAITVLRLFWRWRRPPPPLPAAVTPWERRLAPLGHRTLLVLLLVLPISGWMMSSAGGVAIYWFGLIHVPDLVPRNAGLFSALLALHHWLAWLLVAVLAVHLAAIVRHDVLRRDGVLRRMWVSGR